MLTILMVALMCLGYGYTLGNKRRANKGLALVTVQSVDTAPDHGYTPKSKPRIKLPSWLRTTGWILLLVLVGFVGLMMATDANAAFSDAMRNVFNGEISTYVKLIMNDNKNSVHVWGLNILVFCVLMVVVTQVINFMFDGANIPKMIEAFVYVAVTVAIWGAYDYFTEAIWGIGLGISEGLQKGAVGNNDNFFMAQWLISAYQAVKISEIGIFDGVRAMWYLFQWFGLGLILEAVSWIASMWADFGYAVVKVTGVCFVPFLMLPSTRGFFDKWFQFFVGFVVLKIMLKATMVVAVLSIKSVLADIGVKFPSGFTGAPVPFSISVETLYKLFDASGMMFVAVLFVLSAFPFAAALASGSGNLSGSLGRGTSMIVKKFI